ncbi:MAG: Fe(2+)-trafficking protein [Phycisphaeraceae bacterium]|nr:Fe(2+)-trafficking protein [Phycisphaeraceae bacterium]
MADTRHVSRLCLIAYALAMENTERIDQWKKMTEADPQNAMGWFSLGSAYREAEQPEDAAAALRRAVELDAGLSRAYQLLGQVLIKLKRMDEARQVLTDGYAVAARRGDVMPQRAMASLMELQRWELPKTAQAAPQESAGADQVRDRRTGQMGTRLPDPPMRGPLGKFIFENYSQQTWREWIGMGTKVINELRLDFSNPQHQEIYEQHMKEWLGISDDELAEHQGKP